MRILEPAEISIAPLPTAEEQTPRCEVLRRGQPTGCVIEGAVLHAAIERNGRILLLLTEDIPFEEALHAVLLNSELDVLDSGTLGAMYSTGMFSDLTLDEPNFVRFQFIGAVQWTIELLDEPRFFLFARRI